MNNPSFIFVWKVPLFIGEEHAGNVSRAIDNCRKMLPKKLSEEAARHFNNIMRCLSDVPAGVRKALRNYLFMGKVNASVDVAEE